MSQGTTAQYRLIAELLDRSLIPSIPCEPCCAYDLVVDCGGSLVRVQVKSCNVKKRNRYRADIARGATNNKTAYAANQLDIFAIYIPIEETWYFIPIAAVSGQRWVSLYPHDKCGKYEQYRNNWVNLIG